MRQQRFVVCFAAFIAVCVVGFVRIAAAEDAAQAAQPGAADAGGPAGVAIVATGTATVKAIDPDKRMVTLQTPDGRTIDIHCGKEVRNFDQIKVGDQIKAAAVARLAVAISKGGSASDEASTLIARTPQGSQPGAIIARTAEVSAKVVAVDAAMGTVTLSGMDDQPQKIKVSSDVDLSSIKEGDEVVVRVTKGFAIWDAGSAEAQPAAERIRPGAEGGGAFAIEGATATATVESVDPAKRTVTLKGPEGNTRTIQLGRQCVNFDQIKAGDQVRATLAEAVALSVSKGGAAAPSADRGPVMALAPRGAKPGILVADTDTVTGQIKSIDPDKKTITLSDADGGTRTIKAGPNVNLSDLKEGDDVTARVTEAMAIVVTRP
jgi:Cu/Ag efflux protein CusF